uniref:type II secretion system ATPase GspE n=2 Tax=Marinimicrobium sp. C2-29 TaxID=3139825 RepID=UPI003139E9C8
MSAESMLEQYEQEQDHTLGELPEGEEVHAASVGDDIAHARLPFGFASSHGVMVDEEENGLTLIYRPGLNLDVLLELQRYLGTEFALREVSSEEFQQRLTRVYQSGDGAAQQAAEDLGAEYDLSSMAEDLADRTDLLAGNDDAPIIRLINAILSQAVREEASDIHLEPFEDRVSVRFRIDGVLSEILSPKAELAPVLVSRLKVMARLDIAEKRLPQDGRITVRLAGHAVDIRVSTIPSAHGERIVLRLLDQAAGQLSLEQLAMPPHVREGLGKALHKPHGIILVTGPTGSGKTTTLYAGLSHINTRSRNILTIEDPVEYLLPGIGQTQVNTKVDMTFARGLRAILRQDPDVVMVGEIRDGETAEIAIQASLTGHLVLSTLHTNTAIGAVMRLKDMGVEPFLLASSLEVVMAQRLVRKLCSVCRESYEPNEAERELMRLPEGQRIYRPVGCKQCNNMGYRGRKGIYELIEINERMRHLIHEQAGEHDLLAEARKYSPSISDDGRQCVIDGTTSLEEVLRVTTAS